MRVAVEVVGEPELRERTLARHGIKREGPVQLCQIHRAEVHRQAIELSAIGAIHQALPPDAVREAE